MQKQGRILIVTLLFVLWLIYRFIPVVDGELMFEPDSKAFFTTAAASLDSSDFWNGVRPPILPLFYKVLGNNEYGILIFQRLLSSIAWFWLMLAAVRCFQSVIFRIAIGLLLLLLAELSYIQRWDFFALSESISLSLIVGAISACLSIRKEKSFYPFISLILLFCWMGTKETNNILAVITIVPWFFIQLFKTKNTKFVAAIIATILIFGALQHSSQRGTRWVFPINNVITGRVLTDQPLSEYFVSKGMPLSDSLSQFAGKMSSDNGNILYTQEQFAPFRNWVISQGLQTYTSAIFRFPHYTFNGPLSEWNKMLFPSRVAIYYKKNLITSIFEYPARIIFTFNFTDFSSVMLTVLMLAIIFMAIRYVLIGHCTFLAILTLSVIPHCFLVWLGDAMELGRHSLQIAVLMRIALVLWLVQLLRTVEE